MDYDLARQTLADLFTIAEAHPDVPAAVGDTVAAASTVLFASKVQSYREALLGCALARLQDRGFNLRRTYRSHGEDSFNGRTLDERVVNPLLRERQIPCSKGPYLASFRRAVELVPATAAGLRDKSAYAAMLDYLSELERADLAGGRLLAIYLCERFLALREMSRVPLSRVFRMSLDQLSRLIGRLLAVTSGGRYPVLLVAAMFETLKEQFGLTWAIEVQGINQADAATGAGGDIVIRDGEDGAIIVAVEVTMREVDRARVVSTFSSKIAPNKIADYLFLLAGPAPTDDAREAAFRVFAQGHDISFAQIGSWLRDCLTLVGTKGRAAYLEQVVRRLDAPEIPAAMKLAWNSHVATLAQG